MEKILENSVIGVKVWCVDAISENLCLEVLTTKQRKEDV